MIHNWPTATFASFITLRKNFITIQDDNIYQRVTVQFYARGVKHRDTVSGKSIKTKQQQVIRGGDLLVAEIDAKVGGFGIVPMELDGAIVSSHYFIYEIDVNIIDPYYLKHYLQSGRPMEEIQKFVQGSTNYASIRNNHFSLLTIPLPPLKDQQNIANILDAFALKVAEAKQISDSSSDQAMFLALSSLSAMVLRHESMYPKVFLGDIVEIIGGGTPNRKDARYWNGDIPWVTPKDMKSTLINGSQDTITEMGIEKSSAKIIPQEAILIVVRSNILARTVPIAVNTIPVSINQDLKALVPKDGFIPRYIALILRSKEREILDTVKLSVTMRSISLSNLAKLEIPMPPIEAQQQLVFWEQRQRLQQESFLGEFKEIYTIISAFYDSITIQSFDTGLHTSIPTHILDEIQAQKNFEQEQLKELRNKSDVSYLYSESSFIGDIKVNSSEELTQLLWHLSDKGKKRITSEELWQSVDLSERDIDIFYAYLKKEYMNNRIVESRQGSTVFLEVSNAPKEDMD